MKRTAIILIIFITCISVFFKGYSLGCPVFAATTWENCTTAEQQAEAFKAYCKSRDLTIEGSALDQVTSFTTRAYQSALNAIGLNVNAIQADIKRATDGNNGFKYLFNATGASAMNRVFAQFLQDHDLAVGDNVNNKSLYNGTYFVDDSNNSCLVYNIDSGSDIAASSLSEFNAHILRSGTKYIYDGNDLKNLFDGKTGTGTIYFDNVGTYNGGAVIQSPYNGIYYGTAFLSNNLNSHTSSASKFASVDSTQHIATLSGKCEYIIYEVNNAHSYFLGFINAPAVNGTFYLKRLRNLTTTSNFKQLNIYMTTNNNTINNNTYNNNTYTVINNEGDVYNYGTNDEPDPNPTPDPDPDPDPDPPTPPDPPNGNGWRDWSLPEMPNDWLIYGMEQKFPFDIPFNIMFALSLLNHEPVTPQFEGDIDLKVCTWHYDIDLSPFDDVAAMVRKFEVLAFIIGLAIMTRQLINWG